MPENTENNIEHLSQCCADVNAELFASFKKHDKVFNTTHEGYAVLKEELEELWEDIKKDKWDNIYEEASQVAAMAIKLMYSLPTIVEKYKEKGHGFKKSSVKEFPVT